MYFLGESCAMLKAQGPSWYLIKPCHSSFEECVYVFCSEVLILRYFPNDLFSSAHWNLQDSFLLIGWYKIDVFIETQ